MSEASSISYRSVSFGTPPYDGPPEHDCGYVERFRDLQSRKQREDKEPSNSVFEPSRKRLAAIDTKRRHILDLRNSIGSYIRCGCRIFSYNGANPELL